MSAPARRMLPPLWLLVMLIAANALHHWLPIATILPAPWNYAGILPIVLGAILSISASGAFKRAGTPIVPFEPSTVLITAGFYRFTRNPMYLGLMLVLAGVAMIDGSVGALLPVPVLGAILQWRFILPEERFLEGIFGEQYLRYRARVRRWL